MATMRLLSLLVFLALISRVAAQMAQSYSTDSTPPTSLPTVVRCANSSAGAREPFPCKNDSFIFNADVEIPSSVIVPGSVVIAGLTRITLASHPIPDTPVIAVAGELRADAGLILVVPVQDIAAFIPLMSFNSLKRANKSSITKSATSEVDWLSVQLHVPPCASVKTMVIRANETMAWAEIKGLSCAATDNSNMVAIFIGLGAACTALMLGAMALRVSQWTYVVYSTSEAMRLGYERVRQYVPLPAGPQPVSEEFMRDILREEHEDEVE